jgi:Ca2+-binding EF-hand superfamily protein/thiol-disulfide isomerase/thioredoxin
MKLFDGAKNRDGVLSREGLRTVMQSVGSEQAPMDWLTDQDIDAALDAYDMDKDGYIDREEFLRMAQDNVFLTRALLDYRRIFDSLDTGGNGEIGPTELYRYFEEQCCDDGVDSFDRVTRVVRKYDLNNDGAISFPEFLRMARYEQLFPLDDILQFGACGTSPWNACDAENAATSQVGKVVEKSKPVSSLARGKVHVLKSPTEFSEILNGEAEDTIIVLFASLTWCRPCKKIQSQIEKMAVAYGDACNVLFLKIYGNESDELKHFFKEDLKVRVTPSFFFFQNGELKASTTGATATKHEVELRKLLGDASSEVGMMYP